MDLTSERYFMYFLIFGKDGQSWRFLPLLFKMSDFTWQSETGLHVAVVTVYTTQRLKVISKEVILCLLPYQAISPWHYREKLHSLYLCALN